MIIYTLIMSENDIPLNIYQTFSRRMKFFMHEENR